MDVQKSPKIREKPIAPRESLSPASSAKRNHETPRAADLGAGIPTESAQVLADDNRELLGERKGRGFAVSRAMQIRFDFETSAMASDCGEVLHNLEHFVAGKRDLDWAPAAEQSIAKYVRTVLPDSTTRGIECRTTLCAAEVASPSGYLEIPVCPSSDSRACMTTYLRVDSYKGRSRQSSDNYAEGPRSPH
jgi:hypothetical protein